MKTIGIIAPSGGVNKEVFDKAVTNIADLGYKVKLAKNIYDSDRYLAGSDEDKIKSIHEFFLDPEIDLIMAARGGYGAIRLINKLDYELIKNNPKPIIGFSDVTALLLMIYKKTGLITYHGSMACTDFAEPPFPELKIPDKITYKGNKLYKTGVAEGILWGGNLSTVVSLCGLDFIPDEDFIFFAEDLNEPVYKIDKMFSQLFNIEKFKNNCIGIVLGDFLNTDNEEWLNKLFESFDIPTISGFKITHNKDKVIIPIGRKCKIKNFTLYL